MGAKKPVRPLHGQVMVITGASSGIGLATARLAAGRGAKLVLAARNLAALETLAGELRRAGVAVEVVEADVARAEDVARIADAALSAHGRIDTWVNNAAVAMFGYLDEITPEDHRRLFEVDYWGVVNGSLAAVRTMERQAAGGTIINVGSVLSDMPMPLQGAYVAAKHAVKGFTDTLRIDLRRKAVPIDVTLIKPASIATPYGDHARTYLEQAPQVPPPRYAPHLVARAILRAAETPHRELYVGGSAPLMVGLQKLLPHLADRMMHRFLIGMQTSRRPADADPEARDNLYLPRRDGSERSPTGPAHREMSLLAAMQKAPGVTAGVFAGGIALLAVSALRGTRRRRHAVVPHCAPAPCRRSR